MVNGSLGVFSKPFRTTSFHNIISSPLSIHHCGLDGKCSSLINVSNNRNSDLTTIANLLYSEDHNIVPRIGVPISIPSSHKAHGCRHACKMMADYDQSCYVETKYDGQRMQIHVDLSLPLDQQVQIFSKDRKNSTKHREEIIP
jgi:hypothetical protein